MMHITLATPEVFPKLAEIWERSVRATHFFFPEENIPPTKQAILDEYFFIATVWATYKDGVPVGFIGTVGTHIAMLFIDPLFFKQGIGKQLIIHAVQHDNIEFVDVNEQNPQAINFYKNLGFVVTGRSEKDGQGNPFPIIHMKLTTKDKLFPKKN